MCGIFCSINSTEHRPPTAQVKHLLAARGPDALQELRVTIAGTAFVTLCSTVLSLRGSTTTEQPYTRPPHSTSALCWNGEAWAVMGERPRGSDTGCVYDLLQSALDHETLDASANIALASAQALSRALSQLAGPYAFVFYHEPSATISFGRDFLGRRSLLYRRTREGSLLLSSAPDASSNVTWAEVEADGIYSIHLQSRASDIRRNDEAVWGDFLVEKVPYTYAVEPSDDLDSVIPQLSLNRHIPEPILPLEPLSPSVKYLEMLLRSSLASRVLDIPIPPAQAAVTSEAANSKLAILFSGGLDCTVLARLSHDMLPITESIDLLNVGFENPRAHKSVGSGAFELCPDRITGRASYAELCEVCPGRAWRFIAVDIPFAEFQEHRHQIITLMHPHNTEMDLSIASALYFAARGAGNLSSQLHPNPINYVTTARVLLSGLGADELFAGYTRHATAYKRKGFEGLLDELDLDVARLGKRNLGRDDRVISHWGKEARFPFLDEAIVQWALRTPITEKCDFSHCTGPLDDKNSCGLIEPGKKVLRCLAWELGMCKVAKERKRAIQFGARTAKMDAGKTKGTALVKRVDDPGQKP